MNHPVQKNQSPQRTTLTLKTPVSVNDRLSKLASATTRSKSFLATEAIEHYLSEEEAFVASVHEGIADADAGRVFTIDQVKTSLAKRLNKI